MNLVEHDQTFSVGAQEGAGVLQFGAVGRRFEIEINRRSAVGDLSSERCFADLSRPKQGDGGLQSEGVFDSGENSSGNHPSKLSKHYWICKDCCGMDELPFKMRAPAQPDSPTSEVVTKRLFENAAVSDDFKLSCGQRSRRALAWVTQNCTAPGPLAGCGDDATAGARQKVRRFP